MLFIIGIIDNMLHSLFDVTGVASLSNFLKIISLFLPIFEPSSEKKLIRGGSQMIF